MDFLLDLLRALDIASVRAVVVGGVAVVLHGQPQGVADIAALEAIRQETQR